MNSPPGPGEDVSAPPPPDENVVAVTGACRMSPVLMTNRERHRKMLVASRNANRRKGKLTNHFEMEVAGSNRLHRICKLEKRNQHLIDLLYDDELRPLSHTIQENAGCPKDIDFNGFKSQHEFLWLQYTFRFQHFCKHERETLQIIMNNPSKFCFLGFSSNLKINKRRKHSKIVSNLEKSKGKTRSTAATTLSKTDSQSKFDISKVEKSPSLRVVENKDETANKPNDTNTNVQDQITCASNDDDDHAIGFKTASGDSILVSQLKSIFSDKDLALIDVIDSVEIGERRLKEPTTAETDTTDRRIEHEAEDNASIPLSTTFEDIAMAMMDLDR